MSDNKSTNGLASGVCRPNNKWVNTTTTTATLPHKFRRRRRRRRGAVARVGGVAQEVGAGGEAKAGGLDLAADQRLLDAVEGLRAAAAGPGDGAVTRITLAGMTEGGQDVVLTVNEDGTITTRQFDGEQPITLKRAAALVEARIGLYLARSAYLAAERLSEELARAATHSDDLGVEEAA